MQVKNLIKKINKVSKEIGRDINLMEVCGTHTQVISRFGIREILPKNIRLITGPGCPVCVTAQRDIDAIINLALAGIPVATYGDLLRVSGYFGSLNEAREKGAQVFDVYSVADALELQKKHPELVFFGLGFETTTPMTAWGIKNNLTVYSAHKIFLPAMEALLEMGEIKIDGFIDPGHVSVVIGIKPYDKLKIPQVITGFEMQDVLEGILLLLNQIKNKDLRVINQYSRAVRERGNKKMQKIIADVFEICDGNWRGFGIIPKSGLKIKSKYKNFNAQIKYKDILDKVDFTHSKDPVGCKCGDVIRGLIESKKCPMFGKLCTPDNPVGPCMVSVEGACNVAYRHKK
ncbi:MAG: hydrogenase formation protein HypD [Parcubacteria group bacterium]|jgi:hydrogenase expression/formation protein HypD